jgi:hypothetical protein
MVITPRIAHPRAAAEGSKCHATTCLGGHAPMAGIELRLRSSRRSATSLRSL